MASQMDIRTALRSAIYRSKSQERTNFWFEVETRCASPKRLVYTANCSPVRS